MASQSSPGSKKSSKRSSTQGATFSPQVKLSKPNLKRSVAGKKDEEEEMEWNDILIAKTTPSEIIDMEVFQDKVFCDLYLKITKTNPKNAETRSVSLDFSQLKSLMIEGKPIARSLKRRNGAISEEITKELGMRYYLTVQTYKGELTIDIRRYYYDFDDEEEKPSMDGVCTVLGNFLAIMQGAEEMFQVMKNRYKDCTLVVTSACDLLLRKKLVKASMEKCPGCQDGDDNQASHIGGCLQERNELVNEFFDSDWVAEIQDECKNLYTACVKKLDLPNLTFERIFQTCLMKRHSETVNELYQPLAEMEDKHEKLIVDTVHETGELSLNEREIINGL